MGFDYIYPTYAYSTNGRFDPRDAKIDVTASTFNFNVSAYGSSSPLGRLAAGAAFLNNGNLLIFGQWRTRSRASLSDQRVYQRRILLADLILLSAQFVLAVRMLACRW